MEFRTRSPYKRLLEDMESGKIPPLFENGLLKKIRLKLAEEFEDPQLLLSEPSRKMILHTLESAQEAMNKEVQNLAESAGTFYKDVVAEHAVLIIQDIINRCECHEKAAQMIELFVNNLMTVEEIEMIIY